MHGRKQGISNELLRVMKWVTLLLVCAVVYQPLGAEVCRAGVYDRFSAYLMTYLGTALVIFLLFSLIEHRVGPKLVGTDAFGRAEYYLGMGSGLVRYCCVLLVCLAILNARAFTPAEVKAVEKYQMDAYGSPVFPTLYNVQQAVFERSLTGTCIKQKLGFLLIDSSGGEPTSPAPKPASTNAPARAFGPSAPNPAS